MRGCRHGGNQGKGRNIEVPLWTDAGPFHIGKAEEIARNRVKLDPVEKGIKNPGRRRHIVAPIEQPRLHFAL